jgi:CheY-like chemotaxis protein
LGSAIANAMTALRSILIADDDRRLRESLDEVLSGLGCAIHQAGCGGEAIAELKRSRFDLLLSDIDMPDMTGFQLLSWVTEHPSRMPVVLMSARADDRLGQEARRAGAVTLLPKPVEITSLTSLVHQLLDR